MNAKWLLENHLQHKSMVQYLTQQVENQTTQLARIHEESIEAKALARPQLNGMPHVGMQASPVEYIVLSCEDELELQLQNQLTTLKHTLVEYEHYLCLYDAAILCLNEREKWIIQAHYHQGLPLSGLSSVLDSPYRDYSRATLWRHKEVALEKIDQFLQQLQADVAKAR